MTDYADQRYYNSNSGRFYTPDAAGMLEDPCDFLIEAFGPVPSPLCGYPGPAYEQRGGKGVLHNGARFIIRAILRHVVLEANE